MHLHLQRFQTQVNNSISDRQTHKLISNPNQWWTQFKACHSPQLLCLQQEQVSLVHGCNGCTNAYWQDWNVLDDLQQQQRALLMQVLQLSDADIAALPPGQQEQVRQLVSSIEAVNPDSLIPILTFCSHCDQPSSETTNSNVTNLSIIIRTQSINFKTVLCNGKFIHRLYLTFCPFFALSSSFAWRFDFAGPVGSLLSSVEPLLLRYGAINGHNLKPA